ncbi:MAG: trimethylamine methyltransferase, partial [Chloroflexi bacterium]|nr:trimethylamine methyltransferase [Chloroflexota bacterium]
MSQRRERRKGRRRQRQPDVGETAVSPPINQPTHNLPIYNLANDEQLDIIHQASMQILSEIGIAFLEEESQAILREHGVDVRDDIAYFDPALVEEYVAKAPSQFTQLARNPERNVIIGGNHICFAPVYGPPFVYDQDRGRREAKLVDFHNFIKLAYLSPYIHHSGGTIVEPTDEPVNTRHLDMIFGHIKYSDKPFMGGVMSGEHAADSVAMAEILFGADEIRQNPALISLINISSPRRLDDRMLDALKVYARARQAVIITPFVLSGAMSPVSVAGTVAQLNAEVLAGIAFA